MIEEMAPLKKGVEAIPRHANGETRLYRARSRRRDLGKQAHAAHIAVTSDLARRAYEHRETLVRGFTSRYGLRRLVWYELHDDMRTAIQREKTMKHWPRAWKARLILE